jgi:hypothetical protein
MWLSNCTAPGQGILGDVKGGLKTLSTKTWYHVAMVKVGYNYKVYLDGNLELFYDNAVHVIGDNNPLWVGGNGMDPVGTSYVGYISDLKITKGEAKYTSNFVPPKVKFDGALPVDQYWANTKLLLNAPYQSVASQAANTVDYKNLVDSSVVVTGVNAYWQTTEKVNANFQGAYYFDGNGDYLTVPHSSSLDLFRGDFTIEMFINPSIQVNAYNTLITKRANSGSYTPFGLFLTSTRVLHIRYSTNGTSDAFSSGTSVLDTGFFYHIALVHVKATGTFSIYLGGILEITLSSGFTDLMSNTSNINIGGEIDVGGFPRWFNGYIDQVRITKDIARYTGNFTPPTTPFNKPIL